MVKQTFEKVPAPTPQIQVSVDISSVKVSYGVTNLDIPYAHLQVEVTRKSDNSVVYASNATIPLPDKKRSYQLTTGSSRTRRSVDAVSSDSWDSDSSESPSTGSSQGSIDSSYRKGEITVSCPPTEVDLTVRVWTVLQDGSRSLVPALIEV